MEWTRTKKRNGKKFMLIRHWLFHQIKQGNHSTRDFHSFLSSFANAFRKSFPASLSPFFAPLTRIFSFRAYIHKCIEIKERRHNTLHVLRIVDRYLLARTRTGHSLPASVSHNLICYPSLEVSPCHFSFTSKLDEVDYVSEPISKETNIKVHIISLRISFPS